MMNQSLNQLCPDFEEWPSRWMGFPEDIPFGEKILAIYRPFIDDLIARDYSKKTIKKHIDNLWLLGGELIRAINMDPELWDSDALALLKKNIGPDGGPYCRHLDSEEEQQSFDSTCRKLSRFLEGNGSIE